MIRQRDADKYCKRFGHRLHLVAMLYAQLSGATGLRSIESGFNSHKAHHHHLGADRIKRSTLADANENRATDVFRDTAAWLMGKVSRKLRQEGKELMYLLDSTSLTLKGREFERWTRENRTRNTQGIKVHVLYDYNAAVPVWHDFSAANVNDIERATEVPLQAGALYVFDKGYNDYNWWHAIDQTHARFVTRFKCNAGVEVVEALGVPVDVADTILADELVEFRHKRPGGKRINEYHGKCLRRVTVVRPGKKPLVLATNDLRSTALEIAQHYKARWGIELFFKWVKQHLEIKQFMGRSENAVHIQVLTALIGYLLVSLYKDNHKSELSLWECLSHVRATLFQRADLEESYYRKRRQDAARLAEVQGVLFA
jgi:hypothetical protein